MAASSVLLTPLLALVLAFALALLPSPASAAYKAAAPLRSFGMGYSQYFINTTEQEFFTYNLTAGSAWGTMTHFWATGGPYDLIDNALWSYYLDGERLPSIQFTSALVAGTGFDDMQSPWGHRWFGKGADGAAWYNNFRIPFFRSIRITGRLQSGGSSGATLWTIFRGTENLPIQVAGVTLPPTARLVQQRTQLTAQPLDFVTVLDVPSGSGVLWSHTLAVQSGNQNFMEGCYHAYTPVRTTQFPGMLVSTGTEDLYDSAFYFNGGTFRQENAGLTHLSSDNGTVELSAYRLFDNDPIFFHDGFRFQWRVGDVSDQYGLKCTAVNGSLAGNPQPTTVTAYTWAYTWLDGEEKGAQQQQQQQREGGTRASTE